MQQNVEPKPPLTREQAQAMWDNLRAGLIAGGLAAHAEDCTYQSNGSQPCLIAESTARRRAGELDLKLTKIRETSRWYLQYGPYMLSDDRNVVVEHSMEFEDVVAYLDELAEEHCGADLSRCPASS